MFILCWFLGAQISAKSYKMFEKLSQSGYLGTSLLVSSSNTALEEEEPPQEQPQPHQHQNNHHHPNRNSHSETFRVPESRHRQNPKLLVKVEESLEEVDEEGEDEEQAEFQRNPITIKQPPPGTGTKAHNYHNKAFYLHNHHNNNHHSHLENSNGNYLRGEDRIKERGPGSLRGHHPFSADNNSTCPNCKNRASVGGSGLYGSKTVNISRNADTSATKALTRNRNSIFWLVQPLSMEPQNSSSDLHRKLDDDNNGGNNPGEDDDLPGDDLLEDQVRPSTFPGAGIESEYDEDHNHEDEEGNENDNEMNREDLIRFLLANSAGIGEGAVGGGGGRHGYNQHNYHFQQHQLQQQLLQQQWNAGGANMNRGISASSSLHGAVGGAAGLEPIMDASFQDDFDDYHSDYQWFTESGFETDAAAVGGGEPAVGVPEFPVSLLGETGPHHHHGNAEFDATMAQIDIEDFHSEDILLRLPPLCASDLQQGETIASITGSILQHLEFEDSMTPNSHSVEDDQIAQSMDMSICKSENLFSPMNENQEALPLSTFSTDSLDTRGGDILATCMTNRNNYTIAFQGMEESASSSTYKTAPGEGVSSPSSDILENDAGMMTNWRQVTSNNSTGSQRGSVDNNNGSNESSTGGLNTGAGTPNNNCSTNSKTNTSGSWTNNSRRSLMTQSCPHPPRNNNVMIVNNLGLLRTNPAAAIKLFDIQNVQTVQLAQIYQRHVAARRQQQLGSGCSMTDSGSMTNLGNNNTNNNNNPAMMTSGSAGSSLSSGRHNTPQILEESWNNNRNPIPPSTPTHYHAQHHPHHPTHHPHHHPYSKYNRSRRHSSSTSSSSCSQPTTTQLADAVRKLRSIEIQTSITLVPQPPPALLPHQKLYSNSGTTTTNDMTGNDNASHLQRNCSQASSQNHQQHQSHHHSQSQQQSQPPPVYICYPSYTLPDLRFLEQHRPKNPVILMPQRYKISSGGKGAHRTQTSMACPPTSSHSFGGPHNVPRGRRPMSCNDIEELRARDLSHVKDWPSLNFLLPKEYQAILAEIKPPEKREQWDDSEKDTADIKEEISCGQNSNNNASHNGHATNSEESAGGVPNAAAAGESPVIMRRRMNGGARAHPTKRYSMNDAAGFLGQHYQQQGLGITSNRNRNGLAEKFKRFSLQETLPEVAEITSEIAKNLEQLESLALTATSTGGAHTHYDSSAFVESSHSNNNNAMGSMTSYNSNIPGYGCSGGISSSEESTTSSTNPNHQHHHHHRRVPTNTPKQTSFVDFDNHFQLRNHAFFDDGGAAAAARIIAHVAPMCPVSSVSKGGSHMQKAPIDMAQKQSLTDAVAAAVNQIQSVWETTQAVKNVTGSGGGSGVGSNSSSGGAIPHDNKNRLTPTSETAAGIPCLASPHKSLHQSIMSQTPAGKVVLESLCPALYSLLSDGLCPFLETIFGRVPNTVWRVVEASIQYGPTAQSLNELVLRINSEELLAEGPMKFNAFVCGLLNLRNLGSWLTFLRTKERLLRTHYEQDAFFYLCNTTTRFLYDQMLVNMHLLSKGSMGSGPFPAFQLDIFHETKLLHQSMNPVTPTKSLPASLPVSRKNSVKGSARYNAGGTGSSGTTPRKSTSADARPAKTQSKNSKYHQNNQLKKSQMKRSFSDERPKTAKVEKIPKSKTAQNITHDMRGHHQASGIAGPTSAMNTRLLTRFPSRPKISNYSRGGPGGGGDYHHHHSVDDEGREKGMSEPTKAQRPKSFDGSHLSSVAGGGGGNPLLHKGLSPDSNKDSERFRRLQMQWELLSSDESRKSSPGSSANTSNITAPSLAGSKIPRPINSPTRATITTHLGNVRPSTGNSKR